MKENEVPQDKGNLSKSNMKELTIALSNAIDEINERIATAKEQVKKGEVSPIVYFMECSKMDIAVLSSYVGMWQWRVKRHFKPAVFAKLNDTMLQKYAETFNISVAELRNFKTD